MSLEITYEQNFLVKDLIKTTASCFRIWFADIHLWIQQTKHLQHRIVTVHNQRRLFFPILGPPRVSLLTQFMYLKWTHIVYWGCPLPPLHSGSLLWIVHMCLLPKELQKILLKLIITMNSNKYRPPNANVLLSLPTIKLIKYAFGIKRLNIPEI